MARMKPDPKQQAWTTVRQHQRPSDPRPQMARAQDEPSEVGGDRQAPARVRPKQPGKKRSPRRRQDARQEPLDQAMEASVEECVRTISELIEDARKHGAFDHKGVPRRAKKPSRARTPGAPVARMTAGAKTEDRQLRALKAAAAQGVAFPDDALVIGEPVELIVLACKSNALRCRMLGTTREFTLRTGVRDEVPGEIISVVPAKQWTYARHPYLAGDVRSSRSDVGALGLTPLALHDQGEWSPEEEYWGEDGEPIEEWARPIIARGKRPMLELEQVIPGEDPEDFDSDPILEASELAAAGYHGEARKLLMGLLAQDLRCLDAHAHLGNLEFDRRPQQAARHYEMGMTIGVLSLGKKFDGVLPWGLVDNRPFLRCMHGLGLCAWRLGQKREAAAVFRKMLWLNPGDNQGARFNLAAVEAGRTWEEMEEADR